ncbi:MAG: adenosylcobinamide-GDP ribazoletransferase [Ktedonobacteraceae bacterium]
MDVKQVALKQYREFVAALRFLSVLPVPGSALLFDKNETAPQLVIGCEYFPVVGLLLALMLWLLVLLFSRLIPQLALAALLVIALVMLTGGLHLDGLMDTCDGLFGGRTRERKLEIMRDSRVGSFGVLGALCTLLLKFALLASIPVSSLPLALLLILPVARWSMVLALYVFSPARPTGLGAIYHHAITTRRLLITGLIALIIALIAGRFTGLIALITGSLAALVIGLGITKSIGGLTGDSCGSIDELVEVVTLLVLVMLHV